MTAGEWHRSRCRAEGGSDHARNPPDDHDSDDEHHSGEHEQTDQKTPLSRGWFRHNPGRNSEVIYVVAGRVVAVFSGAGLGAIGCSECVEVLAREP